jgi:hypothetical protein
MAVNVMTVIIWNVMCSLVNDTNLSEKPSASIFGAKVEGGGRVKMKVAGSFKNSVPKKFHCVTFQMTIYFVPL